MIQNKKYPTESFSSNSSLKSQDWRHKEARDMFVLLMEEYENSKRLGLHQRYKELKRIISMFTADPVMEKMKWLSEDHDDEQENEDNNLDEDVPTCEECASDEVDNDNILKGDSSLTTTVGNQMRRFASKMTTTLSPLNTPAALTSLFNNPPSPSTPSSDISDISAASFSSNNTTSSSSCSSSRASSTLRINHNINTGIVNNCNILNNNSAPTTPVATSASHHTGLPHITSAPLFSKFYSESTEKTLCQSTSFDKDVNNTSTNRHRSIFSNIHSSGSRNEADNYISFQTKYRSTSSLCSSTCSSTSNGNQRKNEFDKCIIKKTQIPAFEIPRRRVSASRTDIIDPSTIVPSLYVSSRPNSPSKEKKMSRFRTSSSSPNIRRFFGLENDQQSECPSSSKGIASKLSQAFRRDSRSEQNFDLSSASDSSESSCNINFDIQKGHSLLLKIKQDFEELPNWNVLTRYSKMKKMLKSCGTVDLE